MEIENEIKKLKASLTLFEKFEEDVYKARDKIQENDRSVQFLQIVFPQVFERKKFLNKLKEFSIPFMMKNYKESVEWLERATEYDDKGNAILSPSTRDMIKRTIKLGGSINKDINALDHFVHFPLYIYMHGLSGFTTLLNGDGSIRSELASSKKLYGIHDINGSRMDTILPFKKKVFDKRRLSFVNFDDIPTHRMEKIVDEISIDDLLRHNNPFNLITKNYVKHEYVYRNDIARKNLDDDWDDFKEEVIANDDFPRRIPSFDIKIVNKGEGFRNMKKWEERKVKLHDILIDEIPVFLGKQMCEWEGKHHIINPRFWSEGKGKNYDYLKLRNKLVSLEKSTNDNKEKEEIKQAKKCVDDLILRLF